MFADTGEQTFTVASIYDEEGPTSGYAISLAAFDANVANHVDNYVLVDTAKGYSSEPSSPRDRDGARQRTRTPT